MFMKYLIHQLMKFFKLFFYFFFIYRLSMVFLCFINAFLNLKIPIEQNRCAMACQGCGAVLFLLKKQWNYFS